MGSVVRATGIAGRGTAAIGLGAAVIGLLGPGHLGLGHLGLGAIARGRTAPHARATAAPLARPTPSRTPINFSLVLRLPGRARLDRFLSEVNDPRSARYGRFIDARTFGRRYGVPAGALHALTDRLGLAGATVVGRYPQRTALDLRAPAGVVDRMFSLQLRDYVDQLGRPYHAPTGRPVIPRDLGGVVSAVAGLDSELPPRSPAHLVPAGGLTPVDTGRAYDLAPLARAGIQGQGQRLAVISYATHNPADPAAFSQRFGLGGPAPQRVPVQGGATDTSARNQLEADLDLEIAHSVAPAAQILNYEAPLAGNVLVGPVLDTIVAQHRADVVSISWGQCERSYRPGEIQRDNQSILAADAAGVSVFVASGDQGAYDCQALNPSDQHLSVDWPGASPGVIDVGGTSLSVAQDGSYAGEDGWEGVLSQRGSGGGLDAFFARPSWQVAPGVQSRFSNGARQVPDVSADADLTTGWTIVHAGQLIEVGGTSASAPFWAASMLLVRQYAQRQGVPGSGSARGALGGGAGGLGFVDPLLYQIASTPQPVPAFHDVTVGGNRYYPAGAGWDFATGLGSPDVYNLARDVVSYLRAHGH